MKSVAKSSRRTSTAASLSLSKSKPQVIAATTAHPVVPLKERRLNFGNKWDYAPAREDSKNYVIAPQHELFIGGKFVKPASGIFFESINPSTEQTPTTIDDVNNKPDSR